MVNSDFNSMMPAMERGLPLFEERGSEASTADSRSMDYEDGDTAGGKGKGAKGKIGKWGRPMRKRRGIRRGRTLEHA